MALVSSKGAQKENFSVPLKPLTSTSSPVPEKNLISTIELSAKLATASIESHSPDSYDEISATTLSNPFNAYLMNPGGRVILGCLFPYPADAATVNPLSEFYEGLNF